MKKIFTLVVGMCLILSSWSQECGTKFLEPTFPGVAVTEGIQFGSAPQVVDLVGPTYTPVFQNQDLFFDLYQPIGDVSTKRPLIILAFGGAFVFGTRSDAYMVELCTRYAELGYVVASIDYRLTREIIALAPTQLFPNKAPEAVAKGMHDMRAAIRFFRNSALNEGNPYRINSEQIYVGGLSAGAFCATHAAYLDKESEVPAGLESFLEANGGLEGNSGTPGISSAVAGVISFSGALGEASWLEPGDVPIVSTHGTADEVVPYGEDSVTILGINYPVDGSSIIHMRANQVEVTNAFYTYQGASHAPESGQGAYLDTGFAFTKAFMYDRVCEYQKSLTNIREINAKQFAITVSPNPSSGLFSIEGMPANGEEVELYNTAGIRVYKGQMHSTQLDLTTVETGLYQLVIRNAKNKS
ncbi:MAG: alpha/beta hydrolase fold domain-containing protein, partial [Luteibaculum sp.]